MTANAGPDGGGLQLTGTVVVPVAEDDDARATAQSLGAYLAPDARVVVVNVVEKAGGGIDKASVEQREGVATEAFAAFRAGLDDGDADDRVESRVLYDTDVADAVFAAAAEVGATAIAFTPRGGSRWVQLLTGDVALDLITETDRPVLVLPDAEETADHDADETTREDADETTREDADETTREDADETTREDADETEGDGADGTT